MSSGILFYRSGGWVLGLDAISICGLGYVNLGGLL